MSTFQPYPSKHNADELIKTEDHSDIKNTQKALFGDSTASMSGKQKNQTTPTSYEASKFTLNILGDST